MLCRYWHVHAHKHKHHGTKSDQHDKEQIWQASRLREVMQNTKCWDRDTEWCLYQDNISVSSSCVKTSRQHQLMKTKHHRWPSDRQHTTLHLLRFIALPVLCLKPPSSAQVLCLWVLARNPQLWALYRTLLFIILKKSNVFLRTTSALPATGGQWNQRWMRSNQT